MIADIRGLDVCAGGKVVLRDVRLSLTAGDRVLLSGDNGTGKTSLLRALLPSMGAVQMLEQTHAGLPLDVTALDYFRSVANRMVIGLQNLGLPLGTMRLLTVRGRTSGRPRTTPVSPLTVDARRDHAGIPD